MKKTIFDCFIGFVIILVAGCATTSPDISDKLQKQNVIIGTGGSEGMYFPTGKAICKFINKEKDKHGINCKAKTTKGSVDNLNAFEIGELQFGIAKSDCVYWAFRGLKYWEGTPLKKLRTIFSVHSQSVHILADSSLNTIQDLHGKIINLGNPGSGNKFDALATLNAFRINIKDIQALNLKRDEALNLYQKGYLDAFFTTIGDPNGITRDAIKSRQTNIIPIYGPEVDKLISDNPFYDKVVIPIHWYSKVKNKENVPTLGYKTIFFTSDDVSEEVVYNITKSIFNDIESFKKKHHAFKELNKKNMVNILDRLAPIHPGALKYYREVGLK